MHTFLPRLGETWSVFYVNNQQPVINNRRAPEHGCLVEVHTPECERVRLIASGTVGQSVEGEVVDIRWVRGDEIAVEQCHVQRIAIGSRLTCDLSSVMSVTWPNQF